MLPTVAVAIALPLLIPLFLTLFGKNQFGVEPLYQKDSIQVSSDCKTTYKVPYRVPEQALRELTWHNENDVTLYIFENESEDILQILEKIDNSYHKEQVRICFVSEVGTQINPVSKPVNRVVITNEYIHKLRKCVFLMDTNASIVLIDKDRRIRGYYELRNREEIDRLLVELELILQED